MKYSWGTWAVAVAVAALAFQSSARAGGYGCSSCAGGSYATQPYCAPACQPCQQQTVQHVHVHKSLFGHHGHHQAPMMMPMVQPMVQVPMAMAAVAPVAPVAAVERVAFEQPRTILVERAVAPERVLRFVDTAPAFRVALGADDVTRFRSADVNFRSNVNVTSDVDTEALRTAARDLRSGLSEARNLLDQMNNARNDIQIMTQRNAAIGEATDAKVEELKGEVEILKRKFEELRACLQNFSNVPN